MTTLEANAAKHFPNLSQAEIKVVRSAAMGEIAFCGSSEDERDPTNDPSGARAWGAERNVRGELIKWLCTNREARELVDTFGLQVVGAKIVGPVMLLSASLEFSLAFACCAFSDEIVLQSAHARSLSFQRTHLSSLLGDGVNLSGAFFFRTGRANLLQLTGARIDGQLSCVDSTFDRLLLDGCDVGVGGMFQGTVGRVKMTRARITADLDFAGAKLRGLDAGGIEVAGSVYLRKGFSSDGSVVLVGARIGQNLECSDGHFAASGEDDRALGADHVNVGGTIFLTSSFRARGLVTFTSSRIGGDLNCAGATFENDFVAERARVDGALFWRNVTIAESAGLNLLNTSVESLSDDFASWPGRGHLQLHGFTYGRISINSPRTAKERLNWLDRQLSFSAQPYRQLADSLKDEGDEAGARAVLYKLERLRRPWSLWRIIGYGYYPRNAFILFLGLVLTGFFVYRAGFYAGSMTPSDKDAYATFAQSHSVPDYYDRFHALSYSLESSISLFSVGQTARWQPDPASLTCRNPLSSRTDRALYRLLSPESLRRLRIVQLIFGWFLATMWIAGVTGLVRRY